MLSKIVNRVMLVACIGVSVCFSANATEEAPHWQDRYLWKSKSAVQNYISSNAGNARVPSSVDHPWHYQNVAPDVNAHGVSQRVKYKSPSTFATQSLHKGPSMRVDAPACQLTSAPVLDALVEERNDALARDIEGITPAQKMAHQIIDSVCTFNSDSLLSNKRAVSYTLAAIAILSTTVLNLDWIKASEISIAALGSVKYYNGACLSLKEGRPQ